MAWSFGIDGTQPFATQSGTDSDFSSLQTAINSQATVARSTAYTVGAIVRPPTATGLWYRCSTAGTTAASAPAYGAVSGGATTDGTAVFTAFPAPFILQVGDAFDPHCHAFRAVITGTLTNTNPALSSPKWFQLLTAGTGNYTSGQFAADGVTPLHDGVHFEVSGGSAQYADTIAGSYGYAVRTGGRITLIGGTVRSSASILYETGAIIREYRVKTVSTRAYGAASLRIRNYTTDLIKRNCEHYDCGFDKFRIPTEFSVKAFGAEYVSQYVGSLGGGTDARFTASALSNADGTYDYDNWGAGWVELYDCAKGANLNVVCQGNRANHVVPLFQNINFTVTNLLTVPQQGVRYICTDAPVSNSPTATITTTGNLKTWDFRNAQTYTGETNVSGQVSAAPVLQVWHGSSNLKNLRFPASTATFQLVGYRVRQQAVPVVLGSDTPIVRGVAMVSATNITLTEAQATAITGVSFVPSGPSGGTFTNTGAKTASQIWHAWRYWKGLTANAGSADSWEFDGETLNMGAWSVAGDAITGNFTTTGTITAPVNGTYTDVNNAGQITITGPAATDTVEMRKASDNSLIATRTGPGAFAVSPANVGVSVYFERKVGTVLVMSTQTTPVTLSTVNDDVPMFAGPQVAVANVDGMAKEATLQALATTNQTEHDATQAAIAAIPPVNLTPVLTAVDALPTLAEMEGSWKLTNGGLIDLGTLTYWELSTGSTKFDFFIRYRDGLTTTTGLTAKVSYSNTTQPVEDQLSIFARTGGFAILGTISSDFGQESISVPELVISLNGVPIARGNCIPGGPTLRDIEASPVLAKKSDITALPAPLNATQTQAAAAAALVAYDGVIPADLAGLATQSSVTALGSPAQATALATLASANQSEHDATQTAIAAIPAGVTVAQIRADLERTGGMLDTVPTLPEMLASTLAKQADLTGLATATNVTNAQTAIVGEINANEAKIDAVKADTAAIKAKTDTLTNSTAPTAAQIRAELEATGSKLHRAMKAAQSAEDQTV